MVHSRTETLNTVDHVTKAKQLLQDEADALREVSDRLDESFGRAVDLLWKCGQADGRIGVTGVGKSADIAQKIVGTFNSTGTRAYLLDAVRALHGDLGMVHRNDVVILISNSGESEEVVRLLNPLREMADSVIALTGNKAGRLALNAHVSVVYGPIVESSPFGLAPSTSATVSMAIGHAMAFALCDLREFTDDEFARYHPAGSLGFKLAYVEQYMRSGADLRIASESESVRNVFARVTPGSRRTGAVMLIDDHGRLSGIFTDSDLAKMFARRADTFFDRPISEVMIRHPKTVRTRDRMKHAVEILKHYKISELPVLDELGRPVGMLDVTDLIGVDVQPPSESAESTELVPTHGSLSK